MTRTCKYVYYVLVCMYLCVSVDGGTHRLRRCLWEFMLALIHGSALDAAASLLVLCSRLTANNNEPATQQRDNKAGRR